MTSLSFTSSKPAKAVQVLSLKTCHCVSRCVRRAFLCGKDKYSGQSYEHRRQWVEDRLLKLAEVFAIDICAYAVMSNQQNVGNILQRRQSAFGVRQGCLEYTHVVLHVDRQRALEWSNEEVLQRWHKLYTGHLLAHQYLDSNTRQQMSDAEIDTVFDIINVYRQRLYNISWFMANLNEYIAREANKEDKVTGRFYSQPSLALTLRAA